MANLTVLAILKGNVVNSTNAGSVTFQWAQNTSNGTATTVLAGSYLTGSARGVTMAEPVTIALIAAFQVLFLTAIPLVLANRKARQEADIRAREKAEDYARQDLVAERVSTAAQQAADAATLLLKAQTETIARTDEVAKVANHTNTLIQAQLVEQTDLAKKIHILVNSDMTAARRNEPRPGATDTARAQAGAGHQRERRSAGD